MTSKHLALTAIVGAVFLPACLLIPTPGADGSGCSVETGAGGQAVIVCDDGTSAPLFAPRRDAGPQNDVDGTAADGGDLGGEPEGAPAAECNDRETLFDGGEDPCGRSVVDGGIPGDVGAVVGP